MLSPIPPSYLILSLTWLTSTPLLVQAFPEFLGLIGKDRLSHTSSHGQRHERRELSEEERKLYARQLEAVTGLLGGLAPGTDALPKGILDGLGVGATPTWPGYGSFPEFEGPFPTWDYPFDPPCASCQRGPCPGQNALANHHVINHSGVVTIWEVLEGVTKVYNLGYDIALLSVVLACISGGDPVTMTYSLGGPDTRVQAPLGGLVGLLGQPQGLEHTHNLVEVDCSMTRNDVYETGDPSTMDMNLFMQLYNTVPNGDLFTHEAIASASCVRWHQCELYNPYFYYGPGTGYFRNIAQMALLTMGNHSDGTLDGHLTHDILLSFYGVTHSPEPFTYRKGQERILDNWYRRPAPFDLAGHFAELVQWFDWCPALASIGGNTGSPNSFVGLNADDPASGIANLPNLLDGNNFFCFMLEFVKMVSPSSTNNIYATIFGIAGEVTSTLGCPVIPDLTRGGVPIATWLPSMYPGAQFPGAASEHSPEAASEHSPGAVSEHSPDSPGEIVDAVAAAVGGLFA